MDPGGRQDLNQVVRINITSNEADRHHMSPLTLYSGHMLTFLWYSCQKVHHLNLNSGINIRQIQPRQSTKYQTRMLQKCQCHQRQWPRDCETAQETRQGMTGRHGIGSWSSAPSPASLIYCERTLSAQLTKSEQSQLRLVLRV